MIPSRRSLPSVALSALFLVAVLAAAPGCQPPDRGNGPLTLHLRLASDPESLDPAQAAGEASGAVLAQIFDGLVELDPVTGEPCPSIAREWQVDRDGKAYTFTLDPAARFHNGRAVEADDVVYSFERLLAPETASPHRWILEAVRGSEDYAAGRTHRLAGVRSLSPDTVRIELSRPHGPFLSLLAMEPASILPREVYAEPGNDTGGRPVGAGPFELASWEPGEELVLRASGFHHDGTPALGRISFAIIPSVEEAAEAYAAGTLDLLDDLPAGRRPELLERYPADVRRHPRPAVAFLTFDHSRPPFQGNRYLRRAFNLAIDRDALTEIAGGRRDIPARSILPPGIAGYDPEARGYPYDVEEARRLLARAGYPRGKGLPEITLGYVKGRSHRLVCRRIRENLQAIGVKVNLKELGPRDLVHAAAGTGTELVMYRMAWLADYPDPDAFLRPTLHSSSRPESGNYGRYRNRQFDRALDLARAEPDLRKRLKGYHQAELIAMDDAAWVLLYHYGDEALVKPYVANLQFPTFGELQGPLHRVSLETARTARF